MAHRDTHHFTSDSLLFLSVMFNNVDEYSNIESKNFKVNVKTINIRSIPYTEGFHSIEF